MLYISGKGLHHSHIFMFHDFLIAICIIETTIPLEINKNQGTPMIRNTLLLTKKKRCSY